MMRQLKLTNKITPRDSTVLGTYFKEISKIPLLSQEEEVSLLQKIKTGDKDALSRIIQANLRFVVSVAKQYQNQGLPLEDMINEGNIGLMKATQKFDETRGFKFISYAVWWIRQSILQALIDYSRIMRLPLNKVGSLRRLNQAFSNLEQEYERAPSDEELASEIGLPLEEVQEILIVSQKHVPLDAPLGFEDDTNGLAVYLEHEDGLGMSKDYEENDMRGVLRVLLMRSFRALNPKETFVLRRYYDLDDTGLTYTLEDIGAALAELEGRSKGYTRERLRQIKNRALKKLESSLTLKKAFERAQ